MDKQNVVSTHTGILFTLTKEGNLIHAKTEINLKDVTLSEISQSQNDKYCMIPLIHEIHRKVKFIKKSRMVVAGEGGHWWSYYLNEYKV